MILWKRSVEWRGILLLVMVSAAAILADRDCDRGFYKTDQGFCCRLCRPGTFKIVDCIVDGMDPLCDLCPESTFSNRDHQEKTCMPCGACGPDEEVASACSLAQDTMCQCKEGFKRDPGSELCVREGPSQATIVLGCIAALSLIATTAILIVYRRRQKLSRESDGADQLYTGAGYEEVAPLVVVVKNGTQETASNVDIGSECSSDVHGGSSELTADGEIADDMVRQVMQEYSEDLKKWVGDNTTPLLEHLINNRTITQEVYSTAKSKGGEDCVEFLLHHFLNRGGKEYFRLWNALYAVRRNYLQLWNMFNKKGEAVLAVTKAKPQLKAWIGKDPRHLLLQLINQSLIPGDVISKAKSANSDEDHAEILLDFFIRRGNDDCDKLLFALHIVKNEYPDVKQWLSSLRFLKKLLTKAPLFLDQYKDKGLYGHIRFNKEHISEAIKDDLEPLLTCLEKINYFSTTIAQDLRAMENKHGRDVAARHVIELTLGKSRANPRQFLEVLWGLRDQHPKFNSIFRNISVLAITNDSSTK